MCQILEYELMGESQHSTTLSWLMLKRAIRFSRNMIYLLKSKIRKYLRNKQHSIPVDEKPIFQPGEIIRIQLKEEIHATLDAWKRYRGCSFMDEMWQFCGGSYKIYKKVNHILDERKQRFIKLKDVYIPEGLICEGNWPFKDCDRSCFFFWKSGWLQKL